MAKGRSYLYVIGPAQPCPRTPWVKVGRSCAPDARRASLQTGQGEKLKVHGKFAVLAADAPRLEAALLAALKQLKIKGEVFRVPVGLACGFAEQIAKHGAADEFLDVALQCEIEQQAWGRLLDLPGSMGRHADPEMKEALREAEAKWQELQTAYFAMDEDRAAKVDPIGALLRTYYRRIA